MSYTLDSGLRRLRCKAYTTCGAPRRAVIKLYPRCPKNQVLTPAGGATRSQATTGNMTGEHRQLKPCRATEARHAPITNSANLLRPAHPARRVSPRGASESETNILPYRVDSRRRDATVLASAASACLVVTRCGAGRVGSHCLTSPHARGRAWRSFVGRLLTANPPCPRQSMTSCLLGYDNILEQIAIVWHLAPVVSGGGSNSFRLAAAPAAEPLRPALECGTCAQATLTEEC